MEKAASLSNGLVDHTTFRVKTDIEVHDFHSTKLPREPHFFPNALFQ